MSLSVGRGGEAGNATWQASQSGRACLSLSVSLCLTISLSLSLLLYALSLHYSLSFFYAPLSSFSSHSNISSTLLFMMSAFPIFSSHSFPLPPLISPTLPPHTFSVCLLQFLLLDKNFAFSASCNNFGALWLSSQIFGPCATWAYFYLFAGAVGRGPEEGGVVGMHDELLPESRF